jgi:phage terminase small subunit
MAETKRQVWLEEYFQCWNATEAARRAGYKWPNKVGPALKQKLRAQIQERLAQKAMAADEVLARLSEMARADLSEFITDTGAIDWEKVKTKGYLVKRIAHHKGQRSQIELHDALAALMHLDRQHGGKDGQPLEQQLIVRVIGGIDMDEI